MTKLLLTITLTLLPLLAAADRGPATMYGAPGDRWAGGAARCLGRKLTPTDEGIAHRTLPCGTRVRVTNTRTGLSVETTVIDRGPYGACLDPGWKRGKCVSWAVKRKRTDPGVWRGIADLTWPTGARIGLKAFDVVTVERLTAPVSVASPTLAP